MGAETATVAPSRPLRFAVLAGAAFGAAAILAVSGGNIDKMTIGDALVARYVAAHLDQAPRDVHQVVVERGVSLRYGRIGLPIVLWVTSAGRPSAMRYLQPVLMVACAAAIAAASRRLLGGASPAKALVPFAALGLTLSITGGFPEALAVACLLWSVVLARDHPWPASALLSLAMLTRENVGPIALALIAWYWFSAEHRAAGILATSIVPVVAWHAFVAGRFGHFPLFDPYLSSSTDTLGIPAFATWRSLTESAAGSTVAVAVHLGLALVALWLCRRSLLGLLAAAAGLQVFVSGPFAWVFVGEAARTGAFLQVLLILAVIQIRTRHTAPSMSPARP